MRPSILDDSSGIREEVRRIAIEEGRGCDCCGSTVGVERRHQNTKYDYPTISKREGATQGDAEDPNYASLCPPCWIENEAYWKEMWRDYYAGLL